MKGTWLLPSLNRPHLLKEFFDAYRATEGETPGMVLVDKNDPKKAEYLQLDYPKGWALVLTEGVTMGDKVREVWDQIIKLDWVGILNDDHRPRTMNWDRRVISLLNHHNIVGTNDGPSPDKPWKAPQKLCGAICYSGNVLRATGYMFPPGINHLFHDDIWEHMGGRAQNIQIMMDVCVEHAHAYIHKREDDTHKRVNSEESWKHDHHAFQEWLKHSADRDTMKLVALQPKQGVMLATPSHDGTCCLDYAVGLMDTGIGLNANNIHFEFARVVGSSLIPHARNSLVDMFLKSKCQRLLFVDSDQGFNKNHMLILLNSNRRIVAGITPHKRFPQNLNFEPLPSDAHYFKDIANKSNEEFFKFAKDKADAKGEIEVNRTGTGFIMIDRSVFELMKDHVDEYLAFDDKADIKHGEFFKMGSQPDGRFRGEDWFFCALAKKLKIPIFVNVHTLVTHHGSHIFGIDESKRFA